MSIIPTEKIINIPTAKEAFNASSKNHQRKTQERVIIWMKICEGTITEAISCGEYKVKMQFDIYDGFNTVKSNLKKLGYKVSRVRIDRNGDCYFTISWKRKRDK